MTSLCPCCNQPVRASGDLVFNWDQGTVMGGGKTVRLTPTQSDIFRVLHERYPRLVGRYDVMEQVYGSAMSKQPAEKCVDVTISHINKKLRCMGAHIGNVRGRGFRLVKAERKQQTPGKPT